MGTILNTVDCTTSRKNTGFGSCFADVKQIKGGFLVDSTFKLSGADLASVTAALAALRAAAVNDNKGLRIFPVHRFKNPQNNSDEKTVQAFSDGAEAVVREGLQKWMFQVTNGGLCIHKSLRTHNQNGGYFIFYDADFTLFGWQKNIGELWGIPCNYIWTEPWRMNDGSNVTAYMLSMAFEPRYVNEGVAYIKLNSTLEGIEGLQDIALELDSFDDVTGVAEVYARLECGATNIAALYGAELDVAGAWLAENAETGEPVTIQAVAVVGAGDSKRFQLTFNTGDTDYPDNGTILLSMEAPSVLDGLGVEGFESNTIELVTSTSS